MSDTNFKNELLKQDSRSAVDEEVSRLRAMISAEQKRVRRLALWTIGVWVLWFLMIGTSLAVPMVSKANGPAHAGTTQPVAITPDRAKTHSAVGGVLMGAAGIACIALFFGLPVVGIVLVIMLIVGRITASSNQVRTSLAVIDAQLRMLGAPGVPRG